MGTGSANRVACIAAQSDHAERGGGPRGRSAAGSGRDAVERVGVARRVEGGTDGLTRTERPLRHVGLGDHDRAGLADLPHHEGVVGRKVVRERDGPSGRDHVVRVEVVLDEHRDAEERSHRLTGGLRRVEPVRALESPGVEHGDRVDRVFVGRDPGEMPLHDLAAGCRPIADGRLHAGDRRLHDLEDRAGLGAGFRSARNPPHRERSEQ